MNVKRYIAKDINEAMIKIKSEMGVDAVILNTRKIKTPGLFGFLKKPLVEVVAAIDEKEEKVPVKKVEPVKALPVKKDPYSEQIDQLREMVMSISDKLDKVESKTEITKVLEPEETIDEDQLIRDKFIKIMTDADLSENIAKKVMEILERQISLKDSSMEAIRNAIKVILREYLGDVYSIEKEDTKKTFLFVGPTGVGKTTTLAKLAARLSLLDNKKVGLITADTYRIAAVEQLKTYSEILGIPLSVIYEPDELKDAIKKYEDKDYVLIDTAGRSHKSKELKEDLSGLLAHIENPQIFLVISMSTGYKDIISVLDSYNFIDDYKIIFTKLDEASSLGNILNVKVITGKQLSYFTIGQSVPDDIEVADKEKVISHVMGE